MNVNLQLPLSYQDRNLIARKIAGKDIKRLCSRTDVVELVKGFMAGYMTELIEEEAELSLARLLPAQHPAAKKIEIVPPDLSRVPEKYADQPDQWKVSYLRGRYGR